MIERKSDQQFVEAVKSGFRQSVERLDAGTLSRLNHIRYAALESGARKHRTSILYPAGALMTACLAIVMFVLVQNDTTAYPFKAEDIDILSTNEELDIYEDLEFYQWLEEYEISV